MPYCLAAATCARPRAPPCDLLQTAWEHTSKNSRLQTQNYGARDVPRSACPWRAGCRYASGRRRGGPPHAFSQARRRSLSWAALSAQRFRWNMVGCIPGASGRACRTARPAEAFLGCLVFLLHDSERTTAILRRDSSRDCNADIRRLQHIHGPEAGASPACSRRSHSP